MQVLVKMQPHSHILRSPGSKTPGLLLRLLTGTVQGFRTAEEVQRFSDLMDEMCYIVATKHSGSLKACPACKHRSRLRPRAQCLRLWRNGQFVLGAENAQQGSYY